MSEELINQEPANRIVITKDELRDSKIDEQILLQRSSVPGVVEPPKEEKSAFSLFYSTWFYLLLAGAVGAFGAWALLEPSLDDGIIFTGRVEQVDAADTPTEGKQGKAFSVRKMRISGMDVLAVTGQTKIVKGGTKKPVLYSADDLAPGQIVKVQGVAVENASLLNQGVLVAGVIRMEPPDTPAETDLKVSDLDSRKMFSGFLLFPLVAGFVGLMIGAAEGLICRTFKRAIRCGLVGLIAGLIGGSLSAIAGGLVYSALGTMSDDPMASSGAFLLQIFRRGLAWTIAGMAMGLGQGLALKSRRLLLNGFIGGMLGGLLGGLLFDPIALLFSDPVLLQGAEISRAIGLTLIGMAVGILIGVTELLTRTAWLKVSNGPLLGKEFSFYVTPIRLGSSPKNEIYLFKDLKIAPLHAQINKLRDTYEITDEESATGTFVNGQRIKRHRLADSDRISIGDSELIYTTHEKKKR